MKLLICIIFLLHTLAGISQDSKTITYRQWQDLPQDTYVRIMRTADSLLADYQYETFNVEKKDGSCCFKGLMVIKEFYQRALIEKPGDEDAKQHIKEVENMILDEELLFEEKQFGEIAKRGDHYFDKGYFNKAYIFYKRAYELSPKSRSVKKKMKKAKKKMKKYKKI